MVRTRCWRTSSWRCSGTAGRCVSRISATAFIPSTAACTRFPIRSCR
ncbi:Uncharacterised protein [Bordetella pertussis]|nr:Uncharacterised protein [Bordetella pertussis]